MNRADSEDFRRVCAALGLQLDHTIGGLRVAVEAMALRLRDQDDADRRVAAAEYDARRARAELARTRETLAWAEAQLMEWRKSA